MVVALDLFAGAGGWSVACARLNIREYGVENMPAAIKTREAVGFKTVFEDVWDGLENPGIVPEYDLLIASPPCQTFSTTGKGAGRKALDDVLAAVARVGELQYPHQVQEFLTGLAGTLDPRTALVVTPLTYALRGNPTYILWEQVPTVLPVWDACADVLRERGYSVCTGNLQAEQYGVPQTRKRAILLARRDGKDAKFPEPTHSKYYPQDPDNLDPGVKPWVSMGAALGWPSDAYLRSNYGTGGDARRRGARPTTTPAPTITSKGDRMKLIVNQNPTGARGLDIHEAGVLQSFPPGFPFQGTKGQQFLQCGNAVPPLLAEALIKEAL